MKKFLKYLVVVLVFAVPAISFALDFRAGEQTSVGKEERVTNDVYMGGGSVTSAGNINGDLLTAGGNVVVSGDVGADANVAGGNINILSNVADDVRVAGGTVVITGKVGGDLLVGGGQVNVSGAGVGGDAAIAGGNVRLDAPVKGKLFVAGGNIYINSAISGDVKIEADKVTLGKDAFISGNLTYKSPKALVTEDGAVVKGKISYEPRTKKMIPEATLAAIFSAMLLWKFFALLACALTIGLLFRRWSREIVAVATKRPIFELGRGVLVLVAMPAISVLLFVTLVGIPFGIVGLLGFVIVMLFSWIVTPIIVGSVVYKYFSKREVEVSWKTILLGVVIYTLIGIIPFIGALAQILLTYITLGSLVALKLRVLREWR